MLTKFVAGTKLNADSPKGFVNLYTKLTAANNAIDTTSYVGSVQNKAANGVNFGQVIGWRTAPKLVKIKLRVPIIKTYLGSTISSVTEVWADATQVSEYGTGTAENEPDTKFYYCTGNGVRLRSSPSVLNLLNVVGTANKGDLLGKSDGYPTDNFILVYATALNGDYKLDASGKKISYYVHKDYVSATNPAVKPGTVEPGTTTPVDTNQPAEGNTSPTVTIESPKPAANSVGVFVAIGVSALAFIVGVVNYVRRRTRKTKKKP